MSNINQPRSGGGFGRKNWHPSVVEKVASKEVPTETQPWVKSANPAASVSPPQLAPQPTSQPTVEPSIVEPPIPESEHAEPSGPVTSDQHHEHTN